ncbi:MAG: hypothetical protein AAGG48_12315 [Planctomycetota bacterium]
MTTHDLASISGEYVTLDHERYYRITNSQLMPEFFMSLVGASDHWMFISSLGALSTGRRDPDNALFPYAADDQISAARSSTGPLTLLHLEKGSAAHVTWEPFSARPTSMTQRNLYKTPLGNKLVFEEVDADHQLSFRYRWSFSERFGFVRSCQLQNIGTTPCSIRMLDGLQNILPYGVGSEFMMRYSNLGNAYKKNELLPASGLALFYLSSIPTDRAEPSEGLKTTTVWQTGLTPQATLLCNDQIEAFREGVELHSESDVRGKSGSFFVYQSLDLVPEQSIKWHVVAELEQDHADVVDLDHWLCQSPNPASEVRNDIEEGQRQFHRIVSSSDALQCGDNERRSDRHCSNTVFNVMRGGIPVTGYQIQTEDFRRHVAGFNRPTFERNRQVLEALPSTMDFDELQSTLDPTDADLSRLAMEYLPLAFSRRHGDPTRPWNRFAIQLRTPNGQTNLNYQGNWRDIFQNWEALAVSFPRFTTAMICRFANATTADGYNPYRIMKDGFEWEEPTPDDPWANIGYWGDHQIIYLLRLLESNRRTDPDGLTALLNKRLFVHANVPYCIKRFEQIRRDPQSTIDFDDQRSDEVTRRVEEIGTDGKLLRDQNGRIHHVSLMEKMLTLTLAKLSNFVPDGGIWLNTQRPEWNDANNALVGNGLSMVTTCYLYRWCRYLEDWLSHSSEDAFEISTEVSEFLREVQDVLATLVDHLPIDTGSDSPTKASAARRREITEALGKAVERYRQKLYDSGPSGHTEAVPVQNVRDLLSAAGRHLESSILNNRRADGLFHSYNLLDWRDDTIEVEYLDEMLEGQVAVLSSGLLAADEVVTLLDVLRVSRLYRENQNSYLLYPDRQLPPFVAKNQFPIDIYQSSKLLQALVRDGNESIIRRDTKGGIHFNGRFRNVADLRDALDHLPDAYQKYVADESVLLCDAFVELFGHRRFTGRSGTFFAYEGLGSIYWHMVSKLGLAISENFFQAIDAKADPDVVRRIGEHYQSVRSGIGAEKTPSQYGAFPSDPYSHTPENAGVKQPGMTGQVKEDVLARFTEVGIQFEDGCICFRLDLFDRQELLEQPTEFRFFDLSNEQRVIEIPRDGFALTLCQVPIVYRPGEQDLINIKYSDRENSIRGMRLDSATSRKLFSRTGEIVQIECEFETLKRY